MRTRACVCAVTQKRKRFVLCLQSAPMDYATALELRANRLFYVLSVNPSEDRKLLLISFSLETINYGLLRQKKNCLVCGRLAWWRWRVESRPITPTYYVRLRVKTTKSICGFIFTVFRSQFISTRSFPRAVVPFTLYLFYIDSRKKTVWIVSAFKGIRPYSIADYSLAYFHWFNFTFMWSVCWRLLVCLPTRRSELHWKKGRDIGRLKRII